MKPLFDLLKKYALKFGSIGVLNTLFQHLCYLGLITLNCPYTLSQILSFSLALTLSFILNCTLNYKVKMTFKTAITFIGANIPSFVIQAIALQVLVAGLGIHEKIALLLTLTITVPTSFILVTKGMIQNR